MNLAMVAKALSLDARELGVHALIGIDPRSMKPICLKTRVSVIFPVTLPTGTKVSQFLALGEDLAHRCELRFPGTHLEVVRSPLSVELRRTKFVPMEMTPRTIENVGLQPHTGLVGLSFSLAGTRPIVLDYTDPETPHMLFAGQSGSGKSTALLNYLTSLALVTSPSELKLLLVDPKKRSLTRVSSLPHVVAEGYVDDEMLSIVSWVEGRVRRRIQTGESSPRLLLAIEETSSLFELNPETREDLTRIAKLGRELGIHIAAADQRPLVGTLGGPLLQQLSGRIIGRLRTPKESADILGISDPTLVQLAGKGSMMAFLGGAEQVKLQTYLPKVEEIVEAALDKWGEDPQRIDLTSSAPKQVDDRKVTPKFDVEADLEKLQDVFAEFVAPDGTLRRGFWTKSALALGVGSGGSTDTRVTAALALYNDERRGRHG